MNTRYSSLSCCSISVVFAAWLSLTSASPVVLGQDGTEPAVTGDQAPAIRQQDGEWQLPPSVRYRLEVRTAPRPLRIHFLEMDLQSDDLEFAVVAGKDPDGEGPAEAALTPPLTLAKQAQAIAAINTNAWAMLPDPTTGKPPGYIVGGHADIQGWVQSGETVTSPPAAGFWSCWMDPESNVRLADVGLEATPGKSPPPALWAISGFRGILREAAILPEPSDVLHPRTAIGLTGDRSTLIWIVVDGRQKGISEGVSEHELAQLLLEAKAVDGINLDGGGSSVMLLTKADGSLAPANRPSGLIGMRPVPSILALRARP